MHLFVTSSFLLTLSVAVSGVVARPRGSASSTVCYEDNQLRALERFPKYSDEFCPKVLARTAKFPRWMDHWNKRKVSSACSCYQKTATSHGAPSTASVTGALSMSSTAPAAISEVFATTTPTGGYYPSSSAVGYSGSAPAITGSATSIGYFPSAYTFGSSGTAPAMTGTAPVVASPASNSSVVIPNTVASSSDIIKPTSIAESPSSTVLESPLEASSGTSASTTLAPRATLPAGDTYPPQPPGAGPGKRGLCYDGNTQDGWSDLFSGSKLATYGSNWGVNRGSQLGKSFSYVPTIAVDGDLNNDDWNATVPVLIEGGTKALFASNEPDNAGQANLTPENAATVYKKYMQPFKGTVQLGTPAVTNGGGETGLAYLENFLSYCTDCNFNFINVHHYLERESNSPNMYIQALKNYIEKDIPAVQAKHPQIQGLPIFIGEFWLHDASLADGAELMDALLPYLDSNPNVLAYQAFGGLWKGNFINADATGLTPAGLKYRDL